MILNVSTYRFVAIDDPHALRDTLHQRALQHGLKGTVLLAHEGINLFLAGEPGALNAWLDALRADARFAGLQAKESFSATQPFRRLKLKVKREIVRMNMPTLRPATERPPAVDARTLARWLKQGQDDTGRPVVMLDTRNGFEVDEGAFEGAIDWQLHKFSDFPTALAAQADALRDKTVVSYCTGGIRCEKAALVMRDLGLAHSYQLEGGILKYFEDTAGEAPGWRGRCFVFDERVALDPTLAPPAAGG
ncbi:putative sulfurtransferase [Burkholderiales bacterium JOSHI_001]|nr:putative sulfurtransferase [Burkholderiales bacterium JOSHI_001]